MEDTSIEVQIYMSSFILVMIPPRFDTVKPKIFQFCIFWRFLFGQTSSEFWKIVTKTSCRVCLEIDGNSSN